MNSPANLPYRTAADIEAARSCLTRLVTRVDGKPCNRADWDQLVAAAPMTKVAQ